ncbi:hypothetical protein DIPPA_06910, partial [Diplonema papillatum]
AGGWAERTGRGNGSFPGRMSDVEPKHPASIENKDLLQWVAEVTGTSCPTFEELHSGSIFLNLFAHVFPAVVDLDQLNWYPAPATVEEIDANVQIIDSIMADLKIPLTPIDRSALQSSDNVYNILVTLFFLSQLAITKDGFAYQFERSFPKSLAAYLESEASLDAVQRGLSRDPGEQQPTPLQHPQHFDHPHDIVEMPEIGSIVEAVGMVSNAQLNGVRGLVLGKSDEGTRVLVEFPEPYYTMMVLPKNLRVVEQPKERPPVGSRVQAINVPHIRDLEGKVGLVTGEHPHEDGIWIMVEFPPPHGTMIVRPSNLVLVSDAPQDGGLQQIGWQVPEGTLVDIVEHAQLAGKRGKVSKYIDTADGMMCMVEFGNGHDLPSIVKPQQIMPVAFDDSLRRMDSTMSHRTCDGCRPAFDKLRLQAMGSRQQADMMQRELGSKNDRVSYLENLLQQSSIPYAPAGAPGVHPAGDFSQVLWKDNKSKIKGEVLVTRLKFENQSLQRQLQLAREEKQFTIGTGNEALFKLKASMENEKNMQAEQYKSDLTLAEVGYRKELTQLQSYFATELKRIAAEMKYEEDMMRQGSNDSIEALQDELLQLRQQKLAQEPLVQAMEKTNASLKDLALKYEARAGKEEQRVADAYTHCRALMQTLLTIGAEEAPPNDGAAAGKLGWTPLQALLTGQPLTQQSDMALREALMHHVNGGSPASELVNDLLALAMKIRQLTQDAAQLSREKDAQIESLKLQIFKNERNGSNSMTLQEEFDKAEEEARLREQVARLKKNLEFYREKEKRQKELESSANGNGYSDGGSHAPAEPLPQDFAVESIIGEIRHLLANKDHDGLTRYFWLLVAHAQALEGQLMRKELELQDACKRQAALVSEVTEDRTLFERRLTEFKTNQKMALEEATLAISREKAAAQVELKLTEEHLEQALQALKELPQEQLDRADLNLQTDESRFMTLHRKNKNLQAAVGRHRNREPLLLQLVQKQRELLYVLESLPSASGDQAASLQQQMQQLELEDASIVQQLQQLPPLDEASQNGIKSGEDHVEQLVQEVAASCREQLGTAQRQLMLAMESSDAASSKARKTEVEKQSLQYALNNEQQLRYQLKEECNSIAEEKAELMKALYQRELQESKEVEDLKNLGRRLESEARTIEVFEEVRQLLRLAPQQHHQPPHDTSRPSYNHSNGAGLPSSLTATSTPRLDERSTQQLRSHVGSLSPAVSPHRKDGRHDHAAADTSLTAPWSKTLKSHPVSSTRSEERYASTPRLADLSIDNYNSALAAALPRHHSGSLSKEATHGLDEKINAARRQIEEILASTKGVDAQMAQMRAPKHALPPPALFSGTFDQRHDEAEFARQQREVLDDFKSTSRRSRPTSNAPGHSPPSESPAKSADSRSAIPSMWPDGQAVQ